MAENFTTAAAQMRKHAKQLIQLGNELAQAGRAQIEAADNIEALQARLQLLMPNKELVLGAPTTIPVGTKFPRDGMTVADACERALKACGGKRHKDFLFESIKEFGATVRSVASMVEIMRTDKAGRFVSLGKGTWALSQMNFPVEGPPDEAMEGHWVEQL